MPFSVVPVPVLVRDSNFCVPEAVLLVRMPEYRLTSVLMELLSTVYVELKG